MLSSNPESRNGSAVRMVSADGTNDREITAGRMAVWAPNGSVFVCKRSISNTPTNEWVIVSREGKYLANVYGSSLEARSFTWSPDGRKLAVAGHGELQILNADGTDLTVVTTNTSRIVSPSWIESGTRVVFYGGDGIYSVAVDGSDKHRIADGDGALWVSSDGKLLCYLSKNNVYVVGPDGKNPRLILSALMPMDVVWSRDSKDIAYTWSGSSGNSITYYIGVVQRDGSHNRPYWVSGDSPAWDPQGKSIAFLTGSSNGNVLCIQDADNFDPKIRIITEVGSTEKFKWSPDGMYFVYQGGDGRLYRVPRGGGVSVLLTQQTSDVNDAVAWFPAARL